MKVVTVFRLNLPFLTVNDWRNVFFFFFFKCNPVCLYIFPQRARSVSAVRVAVCSAELPSHFPINLYIKPLLRASWGADLGRTRSAKTY